MTMPFIYEKRERRERRLNRILNVLLIICIVYLFAQHWRENFSTEKYEPRTVIARGDLAEDEKSTIELFEKASPSVVYITTISVKRDFFTMNVHKIPAGTGSGFIWNEEGYIVTNFHVIQKAQAAEVMLFDHSVWKANLVGIAPDKDLAVLKINAPKNVLRPLAVGESSDLKVGQKVFAIGNPFGLDYTLTTGVISGLGREIQAGTGRPIQGVIQTDAAINPGNSGGPLLDSAGRLIGVNTAIYSPSGAYAGVGFAVPADTVNFVVPQLIRYGKVKRAGLGVTLAQDYINRRLEGLLVLRVFPGSGADQAGIVPTKRSPSGQAVLGDIIIAINSESVKTVNDLYKAIDLYDVGTKVTVTVQREKKQMDLKVTLQNISD